MEAIFRGTLDTPLEPVIGLAGGETRWRRMTTSYEARLLENRIGKSSRRFSSRRFRPSSAGPGDGFPPATARWFAT
jgi:hypothetical protein